MSVVLVVTKIDNTSPDQKIQHEFAENGGTIGRKLSNNWVLPDEDRHLSGSHARIEWNNGDFYLVDTSTNGVFIDGSSSPLGRGGRVQLHHGMRLAMGGYNIVVQLVDQQAVERDVVEDKEQKDNFFPDWNEDDQVGSDFSEPINKTSSQSKKIVSDDPFFDFGEFDPDDNEPVQVTSRNRQNNLADLDRYYDPPEVAKPASNTKSNNEPVIPETADIFVENISNEKQGGSIIPDGWKMQETSTIDNLLSDFDDPFVSKQETREDADNGFPEPLIFEEKDSAESVKDDNKTQDPFAVEEKPAPQQVDRVEAIPPITETPQPNITMTGKDQGNEQNISISAFLKGAGLGPDLFQEGATENELFLVGKLFRTAIEGTMEVLRSRSEIKNEMRMDMTTIQPIQNNPVKFSVSTNEALQRLLVPTSRSYMNPEQALNEAYDDIKAHQVAVIAGVQASLVHVLKRFEPEKLIDRLEEESPISASIPIHRQAKLWNKFEDLYEAIEGEAEDDFNRLFGVEFAKAYDEQVALLKRQRSHNNDA